MRVVLHFIAAFLIVARAGAAESPRKYYVNDYAKSPLLDEAELLASEDSQDAEVTSADQSKEASLELAKKLEAEFGAPSSDPPINVVDNAPKPFKAMMAAFESGNNDLAFQYARQYVRYLNRLNERTSKVMGATRYAMASEGLLNAEKFPDDPRYKEFRAIYEKNIAEEEDATAQINLPDEARAILQRAEAAEKLSKPAGPSNVKNAMVGKAMIPGKETLPERVPVDPQGKVDLYLFVRLRQKESHEMLSKFAEVGTKYRSDSRVRVILHSLDELSPLQLKDLASKMGSHVIVRQGQDELVKLLGIRGAPTLVAVSPGLSQAVVEEGFRSTHYIQKIVHMMQGGR